MSEKKVKQKQLKKSRLKIIAIGDPHFHTDNIPEVNLFIERMEELAKKEQPNLIVILGDLLHTHERLHSIPLNKAHEFILKMKAIAKTYILVGNHDQYNNQQFLTENHWMNGLKEWEGIVIVDKVKYLNISDINLLFCPYVPPGRFEEALKTIENEIDYRKTDCIFAHQEFFGCKMGAIVSNDGDRWPEDFPYILSGHIHSKQSPQSNIYYCGSSMQHAFGESEENIIPILTWENGNRSLREINLELPRKKIIYTDVQDIEDYKCPETEDKIKITVSGVYDEFKAFKKTKKYKEIIKKGIKVVFKPKKLKVKDDNEGENKNEKDPFKEPVNESDFIGILSALINKEKNSYLYQAYESIVNNKTVGEEDIMYL